MSNLDSPILYNRPMERIERLRDRAATLPQIQLAVLFGSTARGQENPQSDVDLGLLLEPYSPEARFQAEAELRRAAGTTVDVILLDAAPPLLAFEIARDGVLLFERSPGLWARFQARAMVSWWDWAPIARRVQREMLNQLLPGRAHGPG
jgi:predicted nucleotidyltransferase